MRNRCEETAGFWKYALEHSLLSADEIMALQGSCRSGGVLLGQQLLKDRILTVAQIMKVLDLQAIEPEIKIGELAIREGMLDQAQLEAALAKQKSSTPHPAELILKEGALRREDLLEALIGYIKRLEAD